jgi:hypothetical protein
MTFPHVGYGKVSLESCEASGPGMKYGHVTNPFRPVLKPFFAVAHRRWFYNPRENRFDQFLLVKADHQQTLNSPPNPPNVTFPAI